MIRVVSISRNGIYGKWENALFRHLGKEFSDLKLNPEFVLREHLKGNSTSPKLFELVLTVCRLEMHKGAKIIVSHVLGERMKAQGTDGVSRNTR
jgi:hypothetical protein